MLLFRGQRIRFRGLQGAARAAAFARELQGRCKTDRNMVEITDDVELSAQSHRVSIAQFAPALTLPNGSAPQNNGPRFAVEDFR